MSPNAPEIRKWNILAKFVFEKQKNFIARLQISAALNLKKLRSEQTTF
jgi:hypothetical protein